MKKNRTNFAYQYGTQPGEISRLPWRSSGMVVVYEIAGRRFVKIKESNLQEWREFDVINNQLDRTISLNPRIAAMFRSCEIELNYENN